MNRPRLKRFGKRCQTGKSEAKWRLDRKKGRVI